MSRTIEKVITPYTRSLLKYFSTMTAVSDAAAAYVSSLTDTEIKIIPNGIDCRKYSMPKSTPPRTANIILYIGRLEKRKGVKFLLKAVKQVEQTVPDVKLVIVGDGPDRSQLERYAREQAVPAEFLGKVNDHEKLSLLHAARVFSSPARYGESFGIVLLEAMAAGVPIVAGDNPGYRAVLTGSGKLSLIDPRDTSSFARQLSIMLKDEQIRKVWKEWAAKEVKQYDYRFVVDQYEKLYK